MIGAFFDIEIDFAASYAYADSISDHALLEIVGHPVTVYPGAQLAAPVHNRNWEIIPNPREQGGHREEQQSSPLAIKGKANGEY